jgi:hypothetical protein
MLVAMSRAQRYFAFLGILITVAAVLNLITHWPIGVVTLGLLIGWPVIGTLITLDDDMPGGWSNPDGKQMPEWRTLRWHVDILLCRGCIVVAAFAIQAHNDVRLALTLAAAAILMAAIGFPYLVPRLRTPAPTTHQISAPGSGRS